MRVALNVKGLLILGPQEVATIGTYSGEPERALNTLGTGSGFICIYIS